MYRYFSLVKCLPQSVLKTLVFQLYSRVLIGMIARNSVHSIIYIGGNDSDERLTCTCRCATYKIIATKSSLRDQVRQTLVEREIPNIGLPQDEGL